MTMRRCKEKVFRQGAQPDLQCLLEDGHRDRGEKCRFLACCPLCDQPLPPGVAVKPVTLQGRRADGA